LRATAAESSAPQFSQKSSEAGLVWLQLGQILVPVRGGAATALPTAAEAEALPPADLPPESRIAPQFSQNSSPGLTGLLQLGHLI
jgi:hypothetical protein